MAVAALVAALGLELEAVDLLAALVSGDGRLHLQLAQVAGLEHRLVAVGVQQRFEVDLVALVRGHAIDDERVALLDAVLLTAHSDDRVAHGKGMAPRTAPGAGGEFSGLTRMSRRYIVECRRTSTVE